MSERRRYERSPELHADAFKEIHLRITDKPSIGPSQVCPHTEQCKAKAQQDFAAFPELLAVFDADSCSERNPERQERCASCLGITEDATVTVNPTRSYTMKARIVSTSKGEPSLPSTDGFDDEDLA